VDKASFVYVIRRGPREHKIGHSTSPARRMSHLQGGSRQRLSLVASEPCDNAPQIEAYAHWLLRESQIRGEWFAVTAEAALVAIVAAREAVREGHFAPCRIAGGGRRKQWGEVMSARFPAGIFARVAAILRPGEDRTDFVREAVDKEIKRRERAGEARKPS